MTLSTDEASQSEQDEPFADILNLESEYHAEGYALGVADGSRSGRIEGRVFGLEKGFEKFTEMGRLGGRAAVWRARLMPANPEETANALIAPPLGGSERLRKHIERLSNLVDAAHVPTNNDEEAVSDFDGQLKDAKAKMTLISKIASEGGAVPRGMDLQSSGRSGPAVSLNDSTHPKFRRSNDDTTRKRGEMEDFAGLPSLRKPSEAREIRRDMVATNSESTPMSLPKEK